MKQKPTTAKRFPVRQLELSVGWEDTSIDLLPDEPRVVAAPGLGTQPMQAQWLTSSA